LLAPGSGTDTCGQDELDEQAVETWRHGTEIRKALDLFFLSAKRGLTLSGEERKRKEIDSPPKGQTPFRIGSKC